MKPTFFKTAAGFRAWLQKHHKTKPELVVGFYRKDSGKPSITWQESVDEALCFGWIDGIRRSVDADSFSTRLTPRQPRSIWSRVNIAHVARLIEEGRMTPPGLDAFAKRDEKRTAVYSFENSAKVLPPALEKLFRARKKAWAFYQAQAPWYRRTTSHWVLSAKQEATRRRRLEALVACCARGETIPQLQKKKA